MNRLARIVPIVTVSAAASALVLGQLGFVQMTVAEQVIVGLLALLAIDAFAERIGILRRIEVLVSEANSVPALWPRTEIPRPDRFAKNASTIDVLAVSAVSIVTQFRGFYRERLEHGCRIRVLILDPDSEAAVIHARQALVEQLAQPEEVLRMHVRSTIAALVPLLKSERSHSGSIELRLSPIFAPFSLVGVDLEKDSGAIVVEFHTYRTDIDTRPHVVLDRQRQGHWFGFFRDQFEIVWNDSRPISLDEASKSTSPLRTTEGLG